MLPIYLFSLKSKISKIFPANWSNNIAALKVSAEKESFRTNTDTARVGPHWGNNYKREYNTYDTFGLDGQRLYRIRPWA